MVGDCTLSTRAQRLAHLLCCPNIFVVVVQLRRRHAEDNSDSDPIASSCVRWCYGAATTIVTYPDFALLPV